MENPDWNWQHRVHKMKKNKTKYNTICVGYHSTQANTNNINEFSYKQLEVKTNRTLFCAKSRRTSQHGTENVKTFYIILLPFVRRYIKVQHHWMFKLTLRLSKHWNSYKTTSKLWRLKTSSCRISKDNVIPEMCSRLDTLLIKYL